MKSRQLLGTKTPEPTDPGTAINNIGHNMVDATIGTAQNYIKDVLDPAWGGVKNIARILSPTAWKEHGWKNLAKAPAGLITMEATAIKNAIFGIIGATQSFTRKGISDSVTEITNGTVDHIGPPGRLVGNIVKTIGSVPALVPQILTWLTKMGPDKAFDIMNEYTSNGGEIPKTRLRI